MKLTELFFQTAIDNEFTHLGSFTFERSRAERSKDHNKATAAITKLQRSNAAQSIDMLHSKKQQIK